jgi:hypothetical protein
MRVDLDMSQLTTFPGTLTSDDSDDGPCTATPDHRTFNKAQLRVTKEVVSDALSSMTFEDGQVDNIIAWVDSSCRGTMLAIVSLYKNDRVEVRLLKPVDPATVATGQRDAFALFTLQRSCDF